MNSNEEPLDPYNLPPGTILGPYFINQFLAQGGMGLVYKGFDPGLERAVALKMLKPEYAEQQEHVERFQSEARAIAALRHPHIVPIHYIGKIQGIVFFAMDFLEGENLDAWVERGQLVDHEYARWILSQTVSALKAALGAHIIHLDLKPGNLMLDASNTLFLTDFGLAEIMASSRETGGEAFGTLDYTSPEQLTRDPTDHRTDIYSLGATMFHLMTGRPPYQGETAEEIAQMHVLEEHPFPRDAALELGVPEPWVNLLQKMMEKAPENRFQYYEEIEEVLENLTDFKYTIVKKQAPLGTSSPRLGGDPLLFYGLLTEQPEPVSPPSQTAVQKKIEAGWNHLLINKIAESVRLMTTSQMDTKEGLVYAVKRLPGLEHCTRGVAAFMEVDRELPADELIQFVGPERFQGYATFFFIIHHELEANLIPFYNLQVFWQHSLAVGVLVDFMYEALDIRRSGCEFAAGLFHDIGKVIYLQHLPSFYAQMIGESMSHNTSLYEVEKTFIGVTHPELAEAWGKRNKLPTALVHAWGAHGTDNLKKSDVLAHAVISANHLIKQTGIGFSGNSHYTPVTWGELPSTKYLWEARRNKEYDFETFVSGFMDQILLLPELI